MTRIQAFENSWNKINILSKNVFSEFLAKCKMFNTFATSSFQICSPSYSKVSLKTNSKCTTQNWKSRKQPKIFKSELNVRKLWYKPWFFPAFLRETPRTCLTQKITKALNSESPLSSLEDIFNIVHNNCICKSFLHPIKLQQSLKPETPSITWCFIYCSYVSHPELLTHVSIMFLGTQSLEVPRIF